RDKRNIFIFAPSQSRAGQEIINKHKLDRKGYETIILISNGDIFVKSEAVLEIFRYLRGGWKYLRVLKIFPMKFRDWGYTIFAKFRYKIFGKRTVCMVPDENIRERFLQ
ncbi:MAG: DUF393 domain-containing protein, partial [Candidatus Aminicenantes bacterium]|nr:DUF393 domain-containing protein [Candidatus Aminicenantes bacterium]